MKRFWHLLHSKRLSPETDKRRENLHTEHQHLYLVHVSLDTCVCPGVSLQLVAACESFSAEDPVHTKGLSPGAVGHAPQQRRLRKVFSQPAMWQMCFLFPNLSWPAA